VSAAAQPLRVPHGPPAEPPAHLAPFLPSRKSRRLGFTPRLLLLAALFVLELCVITLCLDTERFHGASGITGFIFQWVAWLLRAVVAFAVAFPILEYLRPNSVHRSFAAASIDSPIDAGRLAAHGAILSWFGVLSAWLFYGGLPQTVAEFIAGDWLGFGLLAIVLAATAFIPWPVWRALIKGSGYTWIFALGIAVFACVAGNLGRLLWYPSGKITFGLVSFLLKPFVAVTIANSAAMELGTSKFSVEIAPQCSGFEGAGLMLIFGIVWLVISRRDFRFPQAWLLVPAGIAAAYLLNGVRLAALIMIGNAGFGSIALGGFHSQAGWIAFNALALAFAVGARRLPWFALRRPIAVASVAAGP